MSQPVDQPELGPVIILPSAAPTRARSFQQRVDYAAKALRRGRWGGRFDACFAEADAGHVAAVLILRAEKSKDLREAILKAFDAVDWNSVPWVQAMHRFQGMGAHEIGKDALRAVKSSCCKTKRGIRASEDNI